MTRNKLLLREKANIEKYINNNIEASVDAIMELYNRIPNKSDVYKSLYRYRRLDSYELEALQNGTIFMRWPSSYEDDEDCTPVFDYEEITRFIIKEKHPRSAAQELIERNVNFHDLESNPKIKKKISDIRNMWMISCFTERDNNIKMWQQYADNCKGICLVYSFKDILDNVKNTESMIIMPVRYIDNRSECPDLKLDHHDLLENLNVTDSKYLLSCTTKERVNYSFEEEWRLILERNKEEGDGDTIGISVQFIDPLIVICGSNIDRTTNEYQQLVNITTRKKIGLVG